MDIAFKSLNLHDFFLKLGKVFQQEYREAYGEYFLNIPENFGSGVISGIHYPNGVALLYIDANFKEEIHFSYQAHQVHPLKFIYSLKNGITHRFNDENIDHLIEQFQSVIVASKYPHGHTLIFPKGEDVSSTILQIDRAAFVSQLSLEAHDMNSTFYELFFDTHATRTIFHKGQFSLKLAQIIQEIRDFALEDFIRTNFIGAKALEMLSYMLLQYEDDLRGDGEAKILRKSELSALHVAVGHINQNLIELPSVEAIAKKVGLSASKLQEGFKLIHNCTVNEYITNKRLETAFRLLSETEMSIGEVVLEIGLSSRSYFSRIFKTKYKISPIELKKKR